MTDTKASVVGINGNMITIEFEAKSTTFDFFILYDCSLQRGDSFFWNRAIAIGKGCVIETSEILVSVLVTTYRCTRPAVRDDSAATPEPFTFGRCGERRDIIE